MVTPTGLEDEFVTGLQNALGNDYWSVMATAYAEAKPQAVVVRFTGMEVETAMHGTNPQHMQLGADVGSATIELTFISAPNPPRTVFDNTYPDVKRACRSLTESTDKAWRPEIFEELEVNDKAEAGTRIWKAQVRVSFISEV